MPKRARYYILAVIAGGAMSLVVALANWSAPDLKQWGLYTAVTVLASVVKLRLPGIAGTYSLSFLAVLFGVGRFSLSELLIAGCLGAIAQSLVCTRQRPTLVQVLFNSADLVLSIGACVATANALAASSLAGYWPAIMAVVACVYFLVNTVLVSGVLALLSGKRLPDVCGQWYLWPFPYYLIGAAIVGLVSKPGQPIQGEGWLVLLPLMYLAHFFIGLRTTEHSKATSASLSDALPKRALIYVLAVIAAGLALLIMAVWNWQTQDVARFFCFSAMAGIAATLKVRLPDMRGTISVFFVVLLVAILELSLSETILMAALTGVIQSVWKPKKPPTLIRTLFNGGCQAFVACVAYLACRWTPGSMLAGSVTAQLAVATVVLYIFSTGMVAMVLCLVEGRSLWGIWQNCYFWSCPYYLAGAAVAGLMTATCRHANWQTSTLVLPTIGMLYVSYRAHLTESGVWGS